MRREVGLQRLRPTPGGGAERGAARCWLCDVVVVRANARTTEKVYRKELRPVLRRGAMAIDDLFNAHRAASEPAHSAPRGLVRTKLSAEMTSMRLESDQGK
jgi:hypothetical protein